MTDWIARLKGQKIDLCQASVLPKPTEPPPQGADAGFGSFVSSTAEHVMENADLYEAWQERSAIMEFDGGMSGGEAERAALDCVLGSGRALTPKEKDAIIISWGG